MFFTFAERSTKAPWQSTCSSKTIVARMNVDVADEINGACALRTFIRIKVPMRDQLAPLS